MIPSLSELEISRLRRKPSQIQALRFNPSEIDFSQLRGVAFEATLIKTGKMLSSISPVAETTDELEIGSSIPYIREKSYLGRVNGRDPRGIVRRRDEQ